MSKLLINEKLEEISGGFRVDSSGVHVNKKEFEVLKSAGVVKNNETTCSDDETVKILREAGFNRVFLLSSANIGY